MKKRELAFYILTSVIICYILGYVLGAGKVTVFNTTSNGKYAVLSLCDVSAEYRDEEDNCRNYNKVEIDLKKGTQIIGKKWGNIGVAIGFILGWVLASYIEQSRRK